MSPAPSLLLATSTLLLGACFGLSDSSDEGQSCRDANDCQELCSPIGECVLEASALNIRVNWTINGVAPTLAAPSSCGRITDFEVRLESASVRDDAIAYFPVPCENGTVFYPNMPSRLVEVHLSGVNELGEVIAEARGEIVGTDSQVALDLSL